MIMKKLFLLTAFYSFTLVQLQAQVATKKTNERVIAEKQKEPTLTADTKQKSSCCSDNPFILTACSQSLLQSFKNLAAGIGVSNCHASLNYPTVSFAMPENCFSHQTTSASMVTYSSFYVPGIAEFRVIWGSEAWQFAYYGACAPNPIIFPHPGTTDNHVFASKLIKQSDYKAFAGSPKDYTTMAAVPAVAPEAIQQIISVYLEEKGGYISTTELALYNNLSSSKGIVVKVKLKSGATVLCYIINNYDTAGTIYWKEANPACVK
jgi:hypothetical protein